MLALADRFTSRGFSCDITIAIHKGELLDRIPKNVRLISFGKKKTMRAVTSLAMYLRNEKPDVLLSTVFSANLCAIAASKLSLTKTRIVTCEASPPDIDAKSNSAWRTALNTAAAKIFYRLADNIIAVSKSIQTTLTAKHYSEPSRITVIYNPLLSPNHLNPTINAPKEIILVACGRLERQKNYPCLLRAFKQVRLKRAAKLQILGDGELRQQLTNLACELGLSDDVIFSGFVKRPTERMQEASVFVHTADYEGFGMVLIEALACNLPIVATDCPGGVREVLADGKYGTLVPVGDDKAIAEAILAILDGSVAFPDSSDHLRQFDLDRVTDAYLAVLFPHSQSAA